LLDDISQNRKNIFWAVFHIVLGILSVSSPFFLVFWFYLILVINIYKSISLLSRHHITKYLNLVTYLTSAELVGRLANASPFIPYELSKYILIVTGTIGLLILGVRSKSGLLIICLAVPAFFYDFSNGQRTFLDIVNYGFGPVAIGLWMSLIRGCVIRRTDFHNLLKIIWLSCLVVLSYCVVKMPNFQEIDFGLSANFTTSGGGASNQVSTVMGLGMFLSFFSIVKKLNFGGNRFFDFFILLGFTVQGLLTFSRGGIMVAVVAGVFLVIMDTNSSRHHGKKGKSKIFILISLFILYWVFEFVNSLTGGNLLLRYQGETEGTLRGTKEVTADHFVTGRIGILEKDIDLWAKNMITGVGCGSSRYLRDAEHVGIAPHVEFSRMLVEHGLLGLISIILLFVNLPIYVWKQNKENRAMMIALIIIALLTTFHAAMRTFTTPLLIILCCLRIVDDKSNKVKVVSI